MLYLRLAILLLFGLVHISPIFAQNVEKSAMDSIINLQEKQISLYKVLLEISRQSGVNFSYDANRINGDSIVEIMIQEESLQHTLDELFKSPQIEYFLIDNQLIIRRTDHKKIPAQSVKDSIRFLYIEGRVLDAENVRPIEFANISIVGTSIGTITNQEGEFLFKIPTTLQDSQMVVSHIGYRNHYLTFRELADYAHTLLLHPHSFMMEEIVIRSIDPYRVLSKSIDKIDENYLQKPTKQLAFYRETIRKGSDYSLILEGILDLYKAPYKGFRTDQIHVIKMRKWADFSNMDTVMVKFKGGLQMVTFLDIIKHPTTFLEPIALQYYQYVFQGVTEFNNKAVYIIGFKPKVQSAMPMYKGVMYIDTENLALLTAEFELAMEHVVEPEDMFIFSRSAKIHTKLESVRYRIGYREFEGAYYLNHIYCDINLRIRKRKQLFYRKYGTTVEMAVTHVDTTDVDRIKLRDRARLNTVLADKNYQYDELFWGDFNYLPPDKPLIEAIREGIVTLPPQ